MQEALDQLSGLRNKPAGRLRLLVPRLAGTELLAPKLAQFARDYPDVVLDITADDTHLDIVPAATMHASSSASIFKRT